MTKKEQTEAVAILAELVDQCIRGRHNPNRNQLDRALNVLSGITTRGIMAGHLSHVGVQQLTYLLHEKTGAT